MVMGTFWMLSDRRWAVTVISWIASDSLVSAAAGAACAIPSPNPDPLKMAAIA